MEIAYLLPRSETSSFRLAGEEYVALMRRSVRVEVLEIESVAEGGAQVPPTASLVFVHPFFYPFFTGRLATALRHVSEGYPVVAVDVADSDRISPQAVSTLNRFAKASVVPSFYSQMSYLRSGVSVPVYVWPHPVRSRLVEAKGCDREFRGPGLNMLFFVLHSGWRKGVDIVARALGLIEMRGVEYTLLLRAPEVPQELSKYKVKLISEWLSAECLKALYLSADVVLVPSRGGGFERNALEALALGVPALVPAVGPWVEYIPPRIFPYLAVAVEGFDTVLPNNPIHTGKGPRADARDLAEKALNAPSIRREVERERQWVLSRFGEDAVAQVIESSLVHMSSTALGMHIKYPLPPATSL